MVVWNIGPPHAGDIARIHRDIETALLGYRERGEGRHLIVVSHIADKGLSPDLRRHRLERLLTPRRHDHPCALGREAPRGFRPDSAGRRGPDDDRDFILQAHARLSGDIAL
jgi:hypothetical protein